MRTTITLNDSIFHALKVRSAEAGESLSLFIEQALTAQLLEDAEDIEDAFSRKSQETALPFATLVAQFEADGLL
jgi:hypothetical protein